MKAKQHSTVGKKSYSRKCIISCKKAKSRYEI